MRLRLQTCRINQRCLPNTLHITDRQIDRRMVTNAISSLYRMSVGQMKYSRIIKFLQVWCNFLVTRQSFGLHTSVKIMLLSSTTEMIMRSLLSLYLYVGLFMCLQRTSSANSENCVRIWIKLRESMGWAGRSVYGPMLNIMSTLSSVANFEHPLYAHTI